MNKNKKKISIYAIITARGKSKRLPGKNIKLLGGKPLIAYTIEAALGCSYVDRCLVSTEDPQIKRVSLDFGAEVIDRPRILATDSATSEGVIRQVLNELKNRGDLPQYFVLLQPTSPLRDSKILSRCLKQFLASGKVCCISICEAEHHPLKSFIEKKRKIVPLVDSDTLTAPCQLLPRAYRPNGAIYIIRSDIFLKTNSLFVQPFMPFFMDQEDSSDIDTEMDFQIAENLIARKNNA